MTAFAPPAPPIHILPSRQHSTQKSKPEPESESEPEPDPESVLSILQPCKEQCD
ncbi:GL14668 [Drosophila persimilis]|uniref:GL14668 n=1 Tax=Drosophila persimilis TaxID=7234 RepID=B4GVJ7_DROPE|nr:GL14668 [Drosophila persimilis]